MTFANPLILYATAASYQAVSALASGVGREPSTHTPSFTTLIYIVEERPGVWGPTQQPLDILLTLLAQYPLASLAVRELVLAAADVIPCHSLSLSDLQTILARTHGLQRLRVYGFQWVASEFTINPTANTPDLDLLQLVDVFSAAGASCLESLSLAPNWAAVSLIDIDHRSAGRWPSLSTRHVSRLECTAGSLHEPILSLPEQGEVFSGLRVVVLSGMDTVRPIGLDHLIKQSRDTLSYLHLLFFDSEIGECPAAVQVTYRLTHDLVHLREHWDLTCLQSCTSLEHAAIVLPLNPSLPVTGPHASRWHSPDACFVYFLQHLPLMCTSIGLGLRVGDWSLSRTIKAIQAVDWEDIGAQVTRRVGSTALFVELSREQAQEQDDLTWSLLPLPLDKEIARRVSARTEQSREKPTSTHAAPPPSYFRLAHRPSVHTSGRTLRLCWLGYHRTQRPLDTEREHASPFEAISSYSRLTFPWTLSD